MSHLIDVLIRTASGQVLFLLLDVARSDFIVHDCVKKLRQNYELNVIQSGSQFYRAKGSLVTATSQFLPSSSSRQRKH